MPSLKQTLKYKKQHSKLIIQQNPEQQAKYKLLQLSQSDGFFIENHQGVNPDRILIQSPKNQRIPKDIQKLNATQFVNYPSSHNYIERSNFFKQLQLPKSSQNYRPNQFLEKINLYDYQSSSYMNYSIIMKTPLTVSNYVMLGSNQNKKKKIYPHSYSSQHRDTSSYRKTNSFRTHLYNPKKLQNSLKQETRSFSQSQYVQRQKKKIGRIKSMFNRDKSNNKLLNFQKLKQTQTNTQKTTNNEQQPNNSNALIIKYQSKTNRINLNENIKFNIAADKQQQKYHDEKLKYNDDEKYNNIIRSIRKKSGSKQKIFLDRKNGKNYIRSGTKL